MQTRQAEAEVHNIRQGSKSLEESIKEFRRIVGRLRHWLEQILTHCFRDGLKRESACLEGYWTGSMTGTTSPTW